jgi:sulfite reductase (NADPH) hemoprotein beta-component
MRQLALIAERWDKGYGHFTTRQNIQFNWPRLKDVPDILDAAGRCRDARHPDQRATASAT